MARNTFCRSADHAVDRRAFLGGAFTAGAALAADMTQLNALAAADVNKALKKTQKRVILLWLAGGASQLETWDPKPGASTGVWASSTGSMPVRAIGSVAPITTPSIPQPATPAFFTATSLAS